MFLQECDSSGRQCGLAGAQELKARDIEGLDAKIADLAATIDKLAKEIATLQAEVAEMQKQLKRAGEDREKENADFQGTIADQRETQKLLTNALNVLKAVYAKKSFAQTKVNPTPASKSKGRSKRSKRGKAT